MAYSIQWYYLFSLTNEISQNMRPQVKMRESQAGERYWQQHLSGETLTAPVWQSRTHVQSRCQSQLQCACQSWSWTDVGLRCRVCSDWWTAEHVSLRTLDAVGRTPHCWRSDHDTRASSEWHKQHKHTTTQLAESDSLTWYKTLPLLMGAQY